MDWIRRHVALVGTLLSALCLAYFYMLDRAFFSSVGLAPIFAFLLTVLDVNAAWLGVGICVAACAWRRPAPIIRVVGYLGDHPLATAIAGTILACTGTILVYHNHPLSMDEYAAVFQAKVFASGHVSAQLPVALLDWLVVPGFNGSFLIASHATGRAIEGYWPGFALLLAPFVAVGIPWLCNALLAGLSLLLIHRITLQLTADRQAAGWAVLFTLASGAFLGNAISYYSMQAHLTANLLFAWLLLKPSSWRAAAAGLVGSLALVLHNPFPHTLFALPWIASLALDRSRRRLLLPLALGYLPLTLGLGLGWLLLRANIADVAGSATAVHRIVQGVFVWPNARLINMRAASVAKLWVWAVPCLLVFATLGAWRVRANQQARLLVLSAALTFSGYLFVELDQGHGWGYRYFHSAWGVLPILAACAITRQESHAPLTCFAGATAILSVLLLVPLQMKQI